MEKKQPDKTERGSLKDKMEMSRKLSDRVEKNNILTQ